MFRFFKSLIVFLLLLILLGIPKPTHAQLAVGDLPPDTVLTPFSDGSGGQALMYSTTTTGDVVRVLTTYDSQGVLTTPDGGFPLQVVSTGGSINAFNQTDVRVAGVTYGTYSNGKPLISGFYLADNGNYYPIQYSCPTCKSDGTVRLVKQGNSPQYNCPDETYPDFNTGTQSYGIYNCNAGSNNCPGGNRTKIIGSTSDRYVNVRKQITPTCVPKCPVGTTYTKVLYDSGCACPKFCTGTLANPACGSCDNGAATKYRCMLWNGSSYKCTPNSITGKVYFDENNSCSTAQRWVNGWGPLVTATPVAGGADLTGLVVSGGADAGQYQIKTSNVKYNLTLSGIPSGYSCSTAPGCNGCPTKNAVSGRSTGNDFFLTRTATKNSWWQAEGAGIYAGSPDGGTTVKSVLPSSSTALIVAGANGGIGAVLRASGNISTAPGNISSNSWNAVTKYMGKKMDYNYFAAKMGVVKGQATDWPVSDTIDMPSGSKDFWYASPTSGTATIANAWQVTNGNSYVIFIDGDLKIENDISVEVGGFLTFIVKGKITVAPQVTKLQGMYISDDSFKTDHAFVEGVTDDVALDIQGSVIAWNDVILTRDLGASNATPAEKFTYRPDLLTNMPDKMKAFAMNWQEVAAGTFGQ